MHGRMPRTLGEVTDWDTLARRISTLTNPIFIAIPLALVVAWRGSWSLWFSSYTWALRC
ncbi:MAG: hypothetical protein H8D78_21860 [Chloroflexi bacterium]|nr:hypothetical protein [Chloroflexota bacterium]